MANRTTKATKRPAVPLAPVDFSKIIVRDGETFRKYADNHAAVYSSHSGIADIGTFLFHRVCFDPETEVFDYHMDPDLPAAMKPPQTLEISSDRNNPRPHKFVVNIVQGGGIDLKEVEIVKELVVVYNPYNCGNPGHTMADDVVAIFRMMAALNIMPTTDNQIALHNHKSIPIADYPCKRMFPLISKRPLARIHDLYGKGPKQYCFDNIAVGIEHFGYSYVENGVHAGAHLRNFRNFVNGHFGTKVPPVTTRHALQISVFTKKGQESDNKYSLARTDELSLALKGWYPGSKVVVNTWNGMTLQDQVQLMAETDVMISQSGSGVMNSIFMRDNGIVLVLAVPILNQKGETDWAGSNEQQYWLNRCPHLRAIAIGPPLVYFSEPSEENYRSMAIDVKSGEFKRLIDFALVTPVVSGIPIPCYGSCTDLK